MTRTVQRIVLLSALILVGCIPALAQNTKIPGNGIVSGGAGGGGFTPAFVTSFNCTSAAQTGCTTTGQSVTNGQFVVCIGGDSAALTTFTCSDSNGAGDTFSGAASSPATGSFVGVGMGFIKINTTASPTFTCTGNAGSGALICTFLVFTGSLTGWDVAMTAPHDNSSVTSWTSSASSVTANASELAIAPFITTTTGITFTGSSGYTCTSPATDGAVVNATGCYKILAAIGAQTATATASGSSSGDASVATIK